MTTEEHAAELWAMNYGVPWDEASDQDRNLYLDHAESIESYNRWRGISE